MKTSSIKKSFILIISMIKRQKFHQLAYTTINYLFYFLMDPCFREKLNLKPTKMRPSLSCSQLICITTLDLLLEWIFVLENRLLLQPVKIRLLKFGTMKTEQSKHQKVRLKLPLAYHFIHQDFISQQPILISSEY